jgi:ferredoxin--NADP+ reductase
MPAEVTEHQLPPHDLVVVGGSLAGLSLAIQAQEAGLERVLIVEEGDAVALVEVVGQHGLSLEYLAPLQRLETAPEGGFLLHTARFKTTARAVALTPRSTGISGPAPFDVPVTVAGRVHLSPPTMDMAGFDVLVIGPDEAAAEEALRLAQAGAGVVVCLGGGDLSGLSRLGRRQLLRLEAERRATVLWHSHPSGMEDLGGFPMVYFGDRRTPDLQFDHVILRLPDQAPAPRATSIDIDLPDDGERFLFSVATKLAAHTPGRVRQLSPGSSWETIRRTAFPHLPRATDRPRAWRPADHEQIKSLRDEHYNATITVFERAHSDLWLLRIRPDRGDTSHLPGQYASLGLGYWEPRADSARDPQLERLWDRLIRRSYSISSPILAPSGYLVDPLRTPELELYIVLVPPSSDRIPALTPRLALKQPGDRIYLGPKVAGRYTLSMVDDPGSQVLFVATGTGEAPHNSMILDLFRRGHYGSIVSVVSTRFRQDLAYYETHRKLEARFTNYHYLPLVTREPGQPKRYVQDVIGDGTVSELLNEGLDPQITNVFACGNPAMIGLPAAESQPPAPDGVAGLLSGLGFQLDRHGAPGNIHVEEYW